MIGEATGIKSLLVAGADRFPDLAASLERRYPEEPYRRAFELIRERLRATRKEAKRLPRPEALRADLQLVERSLRDHHEVYRALVYGEPGFSAFFHVRNK